jgi:hypothetical protein
VTASTELSWKMPEKNEKIEQAIPADWRPVIIEIVKDVQSGNLRPRNILGFDVDVDLSHVDDIYQSIDGYGDRLVSLPEDSWQTSVCRWMDGYWHLLIDLFTAEEGLSDLVLFIDVCEHDSFASFKIRSLYVP